MNKQKAIEMLTICKPILQQKFGVDRLALFGSTARDSAQPDSDIDILVSFNSSANAKRYFGVLFYLEDLLETPVDLVTETALRPELRPFIESETIYV